MNKCLCTFICFFIVVLIFLLMTSSCGIIEGIVVKQCLPPPCSKKPPIKKTIYLKIDISAHMNSSSDNNDIYLWSTDTIYN